MTQGPLNYTGRQMDVALNEGHFLAVALPAGKKPIPVMAAFRFRRMVS